MFTLKISTATAAFDGREGNEIARILREVSDDVLQFVATSLDTTVTRPIRDINGNTVGKWELK